MKTYWVRITPHVAHSSSGTSCNASRISNAHSDPNCGYLRRKRHTSPSAVITRMLFDPDSEALRAIGVCLECAGLMKNAHSNAIRKARAAAAGVSRGSMWFHQGSQTWRVTVRKEGKSVHLISSRDKSKAQAVLDQYRATLPAQQVDPAAKPAQQRTAAISSSDGCVAPGS